MNEEKNPMDAGGSPKKPKSSRTPKAPKSPKDAKKPAKTVDVPEMKDALSYLACDKRVTANMMRILLFVRLNLDENGVCGNLIPRFQDTYKIKDSAAMSAVEKLVSCGYLVVVEGGLSVADQIPVKKANAQEWASLCGSAFGNISPKSIPTSTENVARKNNCVFVSTDDDSFDIYAYLDTLKPDASKYADGDIYQFVTHPNVSPVAATHVRSPDPVVPPAPVVIEPVYAPKHVPEKPEEPKPEEPKPVGANPVESKPIYFKFYTRPKIGDEYIADEDGEYPKLSHDEELAYKAWLNGSKIVSLQLNRLLDRLLFDEIETEEKIKLVSDIIWVNNEYSYRLARENNGWLPLTPMERPRYRNEPPCPMDEYTKLINSRTRFLSPREMFVQYPEKYAYILRDGDWTSVDKDCAHIYFTSKNDLSSPTCPAPSKQSIDRMCVNLWSGKIFGTIKNEAAGAYIDSYGDDIPEKIDYKLITFDNGNKKWWRSSDIPEVNSPKKYPYRYDKENNATLYDIQAGYGSNKDGCCEFFESYIKKGYSEDQIYEACLYVKEHVKSQSADYCKAILDKSIPIHGEA